MSEDREKGILRLVVAATVNVLAARWVGGMMGVNTEISTATAAIAMMLTTRRASLPAPPPPSVLDRAAELLTLPGSIAVGTLASTVGELEEITGWTTSDPEAPNGT